jgi:hypothetical protein
MSHICGRPHGPDQVHDIRRLRTRGILSGRGSIALLGLLGAVSLSEQRHSDAEEAKHRSSQNAEIKEGRLRSGFLFHR